MRHSASITYMVPNLLCTTRATHEDIAEWHYFQALINHEIINQAVADFRMVRMQSGHIFSYPAGPCLTNVASRRTHANLHRRVAMSQRVYGD